MAEASKSAYIFAALMKPFEAVLTGLGRENKDARKIFTRFEASRTWGSIMINTWPQRIIGDTRI